MIEECQFSWFDKMLKYSGVEIIQHGMVTFSLLTQKPGREGQMDFLICIYSEFSSIIQYMFYQRFMNFVVDNKHLT